MRQTSFDIDGIPALLCKSDNTSAYLFVHGKLGCKEECVRFAGVACDLGYDVLGIDLPGHGQRKNSGEELFPWTAVPELKKTMEFLNSTYKDVRVRANSIGAYFSLLAFGDAAASKEIFVSPLPDMKKLILRTMAQNGITVAELEKRGVIDVPYSDPLSWDYLTYARNNKPCFMNRRFAVLYSRRDAVIPEADIVEFASLSGADVTVTDDAEHWFHTPEQITLMEKWEKENL